MKFICLLICILLSTNLLGQTLNQFGHIVESTKASKHKVIDNDGVMKVAHNDLLLPGNSLFELNNGFATLENTCGNTPSKLSFYDNNGVERASFTYAQTINISVDELGHYIYFLCKGKTVIINVETFEERIIASENDIAISNSGQPIYFDNEKNMLVTQSREIELSFTPITIELDAKENVYVFGRNKYAFIKNDEFAIQNYNSGTFFRSKTINGEVFWVEKNRTNEAFNFKMYNLVNHVPEKGAEQTLSTNKLSKNIRSQKRSGDQILCPLYPDQPDYPFPVGNSYAEHQNYGGSPSSAYLHPGIDFLGYPGQPIYATMDGVVKAVLTTSASLHWRLALGLEDTAQEQDGYLFAHLEQSSIPFSVGDSVQAGDFLGYLVEWPCCDFHHLHFARIMHSGQVWDGNWLAKDNVLSDIINFKDDTAPVFEDLWQGNPVAFRTPNGSQILNPNNLSGEFDIICHIHDKINSNWRVDVNSIWFQIVKPENNCIVYEQNSFEYNFVLDVYSDNVENAEILNTIYSTGGNWVTLGNYNTRNFYQNISRTNGDGVIDQTDSNVYFDSTQFPDGTYTLKVFADDAAGNLNSIEQEIEIVNNNTGIPYDVNCNCNGGTYQDSDSDGVCDTNDVCPNGDDTADSDGDNIPNDCDNCDNNLAGTACDDGDTCTTGETYDNNCNCTAGVFQDADNDSICDALDTCSGFDDLIDRDENGIADYCDVCEIDRIIYQNHLSGESLIYEVLNTIQSNKTIHSGAIVHFDAGQRISLSQGFIIEAGADVTLTTEGCNP